MDVHVQTNFREQADARYLYCSYDEDFRTPTTSSLDTLTGSRYQIDQRIASWYPLDHRIVLAGTLYFTYSFHVAQQLTSDQTYTHSPQAGQGMNISMLNMDSLGACKTMRAFIHVCCAILTPIHSGGKLGQSVP
ncbi:hypothetical protein C8J57DRAFT_1517401 [Mycena rebaudengoi]|nr:hypothetical protein C8J57DRAFT_1517401 [Mycena rebaudengoi]